MSATPTAWSPLTVVLVHGAFADGSSWAGVSQRLRAAGHSVLATANPLRSLEGDSAYLASLVNQISGPVLLAGRSYGGGVIGVAAAQAKNVVGLVFVDAVLLAEGESIMAVGQEYPKSAPLFGPSLRPMHYPLADGSTGTEYLVDAAIFPEIIAADLDPETADALAVSQRPFAEAAISGKASAAAWRDLPTWSVFGTADMALGREALLAMARRAKSTTTEVDGGSHLTLLSRPDAVTDVIQTAIAAVS
jgi:pimeloyl-ACP methyl ester carboxylesterase